MKNQYDRQPSRLWRMGWLTGILVMTTGRTGWTQAVPNIIQWQRVIEATDTTTTPGIRAVPANNGGYAVLSGRTVVRLSAAGAVVWTNPVPPAYRDSSSGTVPLRQPIALSATPDSGFVVLARDGFNRYYVAKLNAAGTMIWVKTIADANTGAGIRVSEDALMAGSDGSILVAGTFTSGPVSYLNLTNLSKEGYITGEWRISYATTAQPLTPIIRSILNTTDGGTLLVGRAMGAGTSVGLALKLDSQNKLTAQRTYPTLTALTDVTANPMTDNVYTAVGPGIGSGAQAITVAPAGPSDGNTVATFTDAVGSVSLANDRSGNLTVLHGISPNQGGFKLISLTPPSAVIWTKTLGGSGSDVPAALLSTRDGGYLTVGTTASTNGDVVGKSTGTVATWVVKLGTSSTLTTLALQAPTYTCQTGAIAFNTTGGDGSPITYTAPGVTRAKPTDTFGTVEAGLRNDPKMILIQATQNGQTVSYVFDLAAYCRLPKLSTDSMATLQVIAPTYNCRTGAITFHTSGGNGSSIEYAAAGITDWTTNPNQFVDADLRTAYDAKPLILMARQNGKVVTYTFDLKAECGRARIGTDDAGDELLVSVLGNPVRDVVTVGITGANGRSMLLRLVNSRGLLVEQRTIGEAGPNERQTFDLRHQSAGMLLLHTTSNGQTRTVKVMKQ